MHSLPIPNLLTLISACAPLQARTESSTLKIHANHLGFFVQKQLCLRQDRGFTRPSLLAWECYCTSRQIGHVFLCGFTSSFTWVHLNQSARHGVDTMLGMRTLGGGEREMSSPQLFNVISWTSYTALSQKKSKKWTRFTNNLHFFSFLQISQCDLRSDNEILSVVLFSSPSSCPQGILKSLQRISFF